VPADPQCGIIMPMTSSSSSPPDAEQLQRQLDELRCQLSAQQRLTREAIRQKAQAEERIAQQAQTIAQQHRDLTERDAQIAQLKEQLQLLLSKRYRSSSETLESLQGRLFDESELERDIADTRAALEAAQGECAGETPNERPARSRAERPKRAALPAHFRRVDIVIDVSEAERHWL
jgi:uncharacterized coiled-coil protein SlyX